MRPHTRNTRLAGGIVLISYGLFTLFIRLAPQAVSRIFGLQLTYPLLVITFGTLLLTAGLLSRTGFFIIPSTIIAGVGAILFYQHATSDWQSWAYLWSLVPGFAGLGLFLSSLLDPNLKHTRSPGLQLIIAALASVVILYSLYLAELDLKRVIPVVFILVGLGLLAPSFYQKP
ncbi:MAG: hypothetical protein U1B80_05720 [Anaerolineaceae bacterium]|nr:hypothetical protein [Anaerolineaceae bacterium]